ncbi:MAG: hypothetical protein JF627_04485 [Alphaproteobacteria bacterium]|nr:hypothetical protein [Alphaproteobacteria bacterium]
MMRKLFLAAFLLCAGIAPVAAQVPPTVTPAMDGIFAAFQTHPLVGIGEHHRVAQELEFYAALVRDPRFAAEVGNVVVEFGGAIHQDIIDRYVNGEEVPYIELRKVWTDTVGWLPVVTAVGYPAFFAQVRETNLALPPDKRIHVWLGEPVIDWDRLKTHADWEALDKTREIKPVEVIEKQILARGKKALVIYGAGHYLPSMPGSAGEKLRKAGWQEYWGETIRHTHPGAMFVVLPYGGTRDKACAQDIESAMAGWSIPALAAPLKGSVTAAKLRTCNPLKAENFNFPVDLTDAEKQQVLAFEADAPSYADALLYLGPSSSLTISPYIPDLYLDPDYGRTVARHHELQTGVWP